MVNLFSKNSLARCTRSFVLWKQINACVNTIRQHFAMKKSLYFPPSEFSRSIVYILICIHSKNVRVKISGSFENDPIWVKCAPFNPFSGHTRVNFRRKCLTRNSGSKEKARWRCMKRAGNRPRYISSKLFMVCELGLQTWQKQKRLIRWGTVYLKKFVWQKRLEKGYLQTQWLRRQAWPKQYKMSILGTWMVTFYQSLFVCYH